MKKLLSMLMVLSLTTGLVFSSGIALAEDTAIPALPSVGDTLHGFTVTEVTRERLIDAPKVVMEHDKTGAVVVYLAADDIDRSFDISFRTPNLNSKGISHVFEHATISGSEKYPSQSLFFPIATQTYTTFVNAMTNPSATTYPLSSMSEDQLLLLADFYLDGVFNPLLPTEERLFKREAWRYSLESADAPLTLTGTVYNEMRGNETIQSAAMYDMLSALYPDSILSNVNGGDPDVIPEMTWQDLIDFHETYYHPSNALVMLYGDMDFARFLKLMDEAYFSHYDRKAIEIETGEIPPQTEMVRLVDSFPVEAGSPAEDASIIQYGFVTNDISLADCVDLSVLAALLSHDASPLKEAVRQSLPGASFSVSFDLTRPDPYFSFYAQGVNESDMDMLKQLIDDTLLEIAQGGVNTDILDAILAAEEFSLLLTPEESMKGINISLTTMLVWSVWDSLDFYNVYLDRVDSIKSEAHDGLFERIIEAYLLENNHRALVCTIPVPGEAEQKASARAESLAAKKAAMSDAEISALVEETKALEAWSQEEAPKELIEALTAVTAATLPEDVKQYEVVEGEIDGIATLTAKADVADIGSTGIFLDTSAIPQESLHYLALYIALLGNVDTERYDREALQTLMTRHLYGFSASVSPARFADGSYTPAVQLSWLSLMDAYEVGLELAHEIAFHSKVDDLTLLANIIDQQRTGMRTQINSASYMLQLTRAMGARHGSAAYNEYTAGMPYYDFLQKVGVMVKEEPETLIAGLETARTLLSNRQGAKALFVGNENGLATFEGAIPGLFDGIESADVAQAVYSFDVPASREGIIVDSTVQYNLLYDSLESLGIEDSGKLEPLSLVIYDAYLTPLIRHGIGAYGTLISLSRDGVAFVSYRDPAVKETYAVYEGLPAFAQDSGITQEDLDRYIVNAYSSYALPQGELRGAMSALSRRLRGYPDDEMLRRMREMKATTLADLEALAPVFEKLLANGLRSTSGGAAVINENADIFDSIITVQGIAE